MILRRFGPLIHLSTIRCESKHRIGKMTTGVSLSRTNVCKTIAIKNQLQFCYRLMSNDHFTDKLYECGTFKFVQAEEIHDFHMYSSILPIKPGTVVKELTSIQFHGRTVKKGEALMIPTESKHTFFIVKALIEDNYNNIFIVTKEVTDFVTYDQHYQAYELDDINESFYSTKLECLSKEKLRFAYVSFVTEAKNEKMYIPKRWI